MIIAIFSRVGGCTCTFSAHLWMKYEEMVREWWRKKINEMGGNIPGGAFLGGNFPGRGILHGGVWWVGIFRVEIFPGEIFLEPRKTNRHSWRLNKSNKTF